MTWVEAACDAQHGAGRLLTVYGGTAAELHALHEELPQVRRAPPTTLIQESRNNNDATKNSRTSRLCLQHLCYDISKLIDSEKIINDKMNKKHKDVDGKKLIATVTQKLEYKYELTGRTDKKLKKMPEATKYELWADNKVSEVNTFKYDLWSTANDRKRTRVYLVQLLKQEDTEKVKQLEPLEKLKVFHVAKAVKHERTTD